MKEEELSMSLNTDNQLSEKIIITVDKLKDELVGLAQNMIRIPSINPLASQLEYDGNHLLQYILGADMKVYPPKQVPKLENTALELKEQGRKPYIISHEPYKYK